MFERRWKLTVCGAALLMRVLAAGPAGAVVCEIDWTPQDNIVTTTDLNGDGSVDGADLGVLLGQWGDCPGCLANFNEDREVDCVDREFLLGNWGECVDAAQETGCEDVETLEEALPLCTILGDWEDLHGPHVYGNVPSFDLDTSGMVDMHDVNIVNCLFGPARPTPPHADVNLDGIVNGADLGLVLGAVGQACPDPNQDGKIGWPDIYVLIERWKP